MQVQDLGFKSVAHYLIHTRREGAESPSGSSSDDETAAEDMMQVESGSDGDE